MGDLTPYVQTTATTATAAAMTRAVFRKIFGVPRRMDSQTRGRLLTPEGRTARVRTRMASPSNLRPPGSKFEPKNLSFGFNYLLGGDARCKMHHRVGLLSADSGKTSARVVLSSTAAPAACRSACLKSRNGGRYSLFRD